MIPLKNAHDSGGWARDKSRKAAFANEKSCTFPTGGAMSRAEINCTSRAAGKERTVKGETYTSYAVKYSLSRWLDRDHMVEVSMEISQEDFLTFINRALDGMLRIVEELGEERANLLPDLPGANSPYAILTHCIGVCDYWIGTLLRKREVARDRDAEFRASGAVVELRQRVGQLKARLPADISQVQGEKLLASSPHSMYNPLRGTNYGDWKEGTALIHAYEELAQHHGQMEITRDLLLRSYESSA